MTQLLRRLLPHRIGSQIAGLVVVSLVLANAVTAGVFLLAMPLSPDVAHDTLASLAFVARMLDAAPTAAARADVLRQAQLSRPDLLSLQDVSPPLVVNDDHLTHQLQTDLGDRFKVFPLPRDGSPPRIAVRLADGSTIAAQLPPLPGGKPMLLGTVLSLALVMTLVFVWVARALTAPLARFADAAERFSVNRSDAPLSDRGPLEIRRLAQSLNGMRERIRSMVEDRTHMLAAVSHDLRTPITRMRLRAEGIEDGSLRDLIIRDLNTMQHMVHSALSFLREQRAASRQRECIDLQSLLQTLCDDFADIGQAFSFEAPPHLSICCDPDTLPRALSNLIDNGLKFGTAVNIKVTEEQHAVLIDVEDNGPGIDAAERSTIGEPFYRGDKGRSVKDNLGFGLGLSIVHNIIEAHSGRIELHDATPAGLRVRLVLPKNLAVNQARHL